MRTTLVFIVAAVVAAGCGSSSTTDGGVDDSGSSSDGGGGGPDGSLPPTKYVGYVSLSQADAQLAGGQAYKTFNVGATFQLAGGGGGGGGGSSTTDGPCTIVTAGDAGAPDAGLPALLPAGTLSVEGGLVPVSVMPNGQNQYSLNMMGALLFNGGETLTARATGAPMGAPAFDIAVAAPSKVTLTAPAVAGMGQPTMIPRSTALAVTWTGGTTGTFVFYLAVQGTSVICSFPATAGSGTVPASALGKLTAGGGSFYANTISTSQKVVGEWGIYGFASAQAVTPTQQIAAGTTMFQ